MTDLNYNYIYSKLVEDENDFFGIIAYSIYKRQKIEHLNKFKAEHGREATKTDLEPFKEFASSEIQLEFYRTQANHLMNSFIEFSISEYAKDLESDFSNRVHQELAGVKNSFWTGVWQGVVASFLFVLLVGLTIFFLWSYKQGFSNVIEQVFEVKITSEEHKKSD